MKNIIFGFIIIFSNFFFCQEKNPFEKIDLKIDQMPESAKVTTTLIADYINDNFQDEEDKIRASFYFTASNISYDVENMLNQKPQSPQEKVTKTLQSRKGVCMHYAEIFKDITSKLFIKTLLVEGYTKLYGKVAELSHVWCAIKTADNWYLYDPTWGSGYVNDNKYTQKLNNIYYKATPTFFIQSHIPFDYLWQFLNYPVTNQEFYDGKTQIDNTKDFFDFNSEIEKNSNLSRKQMAKNAVERIEKNGIKNKLIQECINYKNKEITFHQQSSNLDKFNAIIMEYNETLKNFNAFIYFRNVQFTPEVSDLELISKIETPLNNFLEYQNRMNDLDVVDEKNIENVKSFKKNLVVMIQQAQTHNDFVKTYLTKDKSLRKSMFVIKKTVIKRN
jgi:Transglutaminase-like superfamily